MEAAWGLREEVHQVNKCFGRLEARFCFGWPPRMLAVSGNQHIRGFPNVSETRGYLIEVLKKRNPTLRGLYQGS